MMRIDWNGMIFETPCVTFYLWSRWRAAALEHRLYEVVQGLPRVKTESSPGEERAHITDPKSWQAALESVSRVLKGWQEEADPGAERRSWRWLIEGDADPDGFDHAGERFGLWGFLQATVQTGGPGEPEKGEDIDLEGFGLKIWGGES
jgi:hypothetical protein